MNVDKTFFLAINTRNRFACILIGLREASGIWLVADALSFLISDCVHQVTETGRFPVWLHPQDSWYPPILMLRKCELSACQGLGQAQADWLPPPFPLPLFSSITDNTYLFCLLIRYRAARTCRDSLRWRRRSASGARLSIPLTLISSPSSVAQDPTDATS